MKISNRDRYNKLNLLNAGAVGFDFGSAGSGEVHREGDFSLF